MIKLIQVIVIFILVNNTFALAADNLQAYKALQNKDYDKALFYLSYEANLGDDKAQYNLGIMYKNGLGVPVDKNKAFAWLFLSAEQGNTLANYALGHAYYKGEGITLNYQLAFKAYKTAVLLGYPVAKINMGNMYFYGFSVKKNYTKAYLLWRLAEDLNIDGARQNIEMIQEKMNNNEKNNSLRIYQNCMKISLYNCLKDN